MKRRMFIVCGLAWCIFGLCVGVFSLRYLVGGADSQDSAALLGIFSPDTSASIMVGLIHVVGFFTLTAFCLLIGVGLLIHGLAFRGSDKDTLAPPMKP